MGKSLDPAIALFAKLPIPGGVKTRLQPSVGKAGAARLAASMIVDRLKMIDELMDDAGHQKLLCGDQPEVNPFLPYLAQALGKSNWRGRIKSRQGDLGARGWNYRNQGAGGLGQRIFRVIKDFRKGGCIVIGSDAIAQKSEFLNTALKILAEGQAVIQPADDEGFTLLGLPAGDPANGWDFLEASLCGGRPDGRHSPGIAWAEVSSALLNSGLSPRILDKELDIDEWSDVESVLERAAEFPERRRFMSQFLQELSFISKDVWRVSDDLPILTAGEAAPTVPAEKE